MSNVIDPIFPRRWVPPFLRNQFAQEEIVHTRVWICGFYDNHDLDGGEFRYHAEREGKDYTVKFSGGTVYLYEE